MHAYPFFWVASVVASNCNASNWHVLSFNSWFSLWIGRNIFSTPQLCTFNKSHVLLNLRHSSLISVPARLFPRGLWENTKTNSVPKWRQIWTFQKPVKKSHVAVQIEIFFRRGSRSNVYNVLSLKKEKTFRLRALKE